MASVYWKALWNSSYKEVDKGMFRNSAVENQREPKIVIAIQNIGLEGQRTLPSIRFSRNLSKKGKKQ
jgi:hypothetical protein